jgi:DNA-binding NtrC family response regulator
LDDIPTTAGRTANREAPASTAPPRPRVLIIDDDQDVAAGTAELLTDSGFSVRTALSAQDAVETARSFDAQIALVDMNLGYASNGLNLIPALLDLRPRLVTVVVTAYRNQRAVDAVARSGAHGYLRKPFYPHHLFMVLDRSIERMRAQGRKTGPGATIRAA